MARSNIRITSKPLIVATSRRHWIEGDTHFFGYPQYLVSGSRIPWYAYHNGSVELVANLP